MFVNIKLFLKKNISPRNWERTKFFLLPYLEKLEQIVNFLIYVTFWLLPIGFLGSYGRRKKVVLFYDLRVSTYRFDAVSGLLAAATSVKLGKGEKFDLVIYDPIIGRREDGPLKYNDTDGKRLHYLISVIFESLNVIGKVDEIHYIRSPFSLFSIWLTTKFSHLLPRFYTPFFPKAAYFLTNLLKVVEKDESAVPRFVTSPVFDEKVDQYLESIGVTSPFLTLSVRGKSWEKKYWNWTEEEHTAMLKIAEDLRAHGLVKYILVLKDFENPFITDQDFDYTEKDFIVVPEATLSVRFRVSLCAKATLNLCGTNGTSQFALFNSPTCLFYNRDNWSVGDDGVGDFHSLYNNTYIVSELESLQSSEILTKLITMVSESNS